MLVNYIFYFNNYTLKCKYYKFVKIFFEKLSISYATNIYYIEYYFNIEEYWMSNKIRIQLIIYINVLFMYINVIIYFTFCMYLLAVAKILFISCSGQSSIFEIHFCTAFLNFSFDVKVGQYAYLLIFGYPRRGYH